MKKIKDCFPKQRKPAKISNVDVLNAVLYLVENGCKWRGLPKEYGDWHVIYVRVNRWAKKSPVICEITITAGNDYLSQLVEPNVNPSSRRFKAIEALSAQGIFTGVLLMPVLPFIEDSEENIISILEQARDSGAQFVYPYFGVTLRQNQREWFYEQLQKRFPQKHLDRLYCETYGMTYECISINENRLKKLFESICQKHSLLFKMDDIIQTYLSKYVYDQLSFF